MATPRKPKHLHKKNGRPPSVDAMVLKKLEEAFAYGATDLEASFYAGISAATLYNYQEKNPDFVERKEALKQQPVLLARQTVIQGLHDPANARWYLERRAKKEFSVRVENVDDSITNYAKADMEAEQKKIDDIDELLKGVKNMRTKKVKIVKAK